MRRRGQNSRLGPVLLAGLFLLGLARSVNGESAATCPCLVSGGEPGPGNCPCDVGLCYSRCVQELCPGFPQCTLECSFRCHCDTQISGCPTHEDPGPTPTAAPTCAGDCDGNGQVTVDELVRGVTMALGLATADDCRNLDRNGDSQITIDELMKAVNTALYGCVRQPAASETPSRTPSPSRTVDSELPTQVMTEVADTLCWDRFDVRGATVHCESSIGHRGQVSLNGFTDASLAIQAFGVPTDNEVEEEFLDGVLRIDSRPNPCCPGSGGLIQNWRWHSGCWIVSGYAFDDTHCLLAPQPRSAVETIVNAADGSRLFSSCLGEAEQSHPPDAQKDARN